VYARACVAPRSWRGPARGLLVVGWVGLAFGPVQFVTPVVFAVVAVTAFRHGRADLS
jgi:hypothetical protein